MAQLPHNSDFHDGEQAPQPDSKSDGPEREAAHERPTLATCPSTPPTCLSLWSTDDPTGLVARAGDLHPYDAAKTYVALLHGMAMATGHSDDDRFERLLAELDVLAPMLYQVGADMQSEVVEGFHDGVQEMLNDLVVAPLMAMRRADS